VSEFNRHIREARRCVRRAVESPGVRDTDGWLALAGARLATARAGLGLVPPGVVLVPVDRRDLEFLEQMVSFYADGDTEWDAEAERVLHSIVESARKSGHGTPAHTLFPGES